MLNKISFSSNFAHKTNIKRLSTASVHANMLDVLGGEQWLSKVVKSAYKE